MSMAEVDLEVLLNAVTEQKGLGISSAKINYYQDEKFLHFYYKPIHDILLYHKMPLDLFVETQALTKGVSIESVGRDKIISDFLFEFTNNYPTRRILGYKRASSTVEVRAVDD